MCRIVLILLLFLTLPLSAMTNNDLTPLRAIDLEGRLFQVWKMAKAFGERNQIDCRWIVYFKDPLWIDVIYKILKEPGDGGSSCGFFGSVSVPEKLNRSIAQRFLSKSRSTLHIIDLPNVSMSFNQIKDGNNSTLNEFRNYYLINIPEHSSKNSYKIADYFMDAPLKFNSLTFAFSIENSQEDGYSREIIHIFEVYKINATSKVVEVNYYGNWSEVGERSTLLVSNDIIWKRRGDLKGYYFRAGGALYNTFCSYIENNCTKPDCFKGITGDVWDTLRSVLNFSYAVFENHVWGSMENNSGVVKWNGLIGQLINDEIDIAAADFTVSFNRSEVIDFLPTLIQSFVQIFIKNPSASRNWLVFIEPITWQAWIVILVFFICVPPIICFIFFYGKENLREDFKLSDCYCFAYRAFLFHGWDYTPTFLQNRIAFITVIITAMICYWHWEAMIISYLAVRKIVLPYESLEQLLSKSNDKVITLKGVLYGDMFRYAKNPIWKKVYEERMKNNFGNFPESDDQLLEKLLEGGYAVFDSASGWKTKPEYLDCSIVDLPIAFSEQLAYAMQKDSPFYWLFHYHITKMKESGTLSEILNKYSTKGQICPDKSGEALGMNQCSFAFIIITSGGALGMIMLGLETCLPQKWIISISTFVDKSFENGLEMICRIRFNIFVDRINKDFKKENIRRDIKISDDNWHYKSRSELIQNIKAYDRKTKELMSQIVKLSAMVPKENQVSNENEKTETNK